MSPSLFQKKCCRLSVALFLATQLFGRADTTLVFNEVMYHPATNEPAMEWVELYNQLAVDLDVSGWSITGDIGFVFPAGTKVSGRSYIVVAINPAVLTAATGLGNVFGPFTNRLSNANGTIRLRNNNGRVMDELSYGTENEWPVAADGAGPSLAKADEDAGTAESANWRASLQVGGTPGAINIPRATSAIVTRTHVPLDQFWRYDQSGTDLGTAWKEPGFIDASWPSGRGVLAREDNSSIAPLTNTVLSLSNAANQRIFTYYFRTHFTLTNNPANDTFSAANLLDDGVVMYVNGAEVYRLRVPTNQVFTTLATNQANEGAFETITIPSSAFVQGDNVIAAEVHQVNNGSTDIAFGFRLDDVSTVTNTPSGSATNLPIVFNEMSSV
ncbi:MAG TPA: lamin tail domain-containing protein, partial [Candidatus Acidoferrum sp.]|nr:lamin tail domain-containing protein [Candidatus Acidoferrum sp.]